MDPLQPRGLIYLARRGGDWPQSANDEDIAEALVEESLEEAMTLCRAFFER